MGALWNLIYPPICYFCYMRLKHQKECLCAACFSQLKKNERELFLSPQTVFKYFHQAFALFYYEHIMRVLIHEFKYNEKKIIGDFLCQIAIERIPQKMPELLEVDIIVGIPMHSTRLRSRFFNHAQYLSGKIAEGFQIKENSKLIQRVRNVQKQALTGINQRFENQKNSFRIRVPEEFSQRKVLIIDDVYTSGATVNELSYELKKAGATRIYVFTIASSQSFVAG